MIKVNRLGLLAAAVKCSKIAPGKADKPILSHVAIEAKGGSLTYRATRVSVTLEGAMPCDGQGAFTVNVRDFAGALAACEGEQVKIDLKPDALKLQGSGKRQFTLKTLALEDFPPRQGDPRERGKIDVGLFIKAINSAAFAAAPEGDDREWLRAINIVSSGHSLRAQATNGHRLVSAVFAHDGEDFEMLLSGSGARAVLELAHDGTIGLAEDDRFIRFSREAESLTIAKVIGVFPPIDYALKEHLPHSIEIDTAQLLDSIKAVCQVDAEGDLLLTFGDTLKLQATGQNAATDEIDVQCPAAAKVGISSKYLTEALKACGSKSVSLHYSDGEVGSMFRVLAGDWHGIILPINLNTMRGKGKL